MSRCSTIYGLNCASYVGLKTQPACNQVKMFLVLQFPGAQGTASPLISWMLSLPICLQHIQLVWLLHGTVGPRFRPKAIDFKTESLEPMFEAVFFTNWKTGLGVFLNVSVF